MKRHSSGHLNSCQMESKGESINILYDNLSAVNHFLKSTSFPHLAMVSKIRRDSINNVSIYPIGI